MAGFGFRLYTASLREGSGRTEVPWVVGSFAYPAHLVDVGNVLEQMPNPHTGIWPIPHPADLSQRDLESLVGPLSARMVKDEMIGRVDEVRAHNDHRASMSMTIGRVGAYDRAMGSVDDSLKNRAAGRQYRGMLVVAPSGTDGLIAIESIGRTTPNVEFGKLLALGSRYLSLASGAPWWRMVFNQVIDGDRLREVLAEDEAAVVLTRTTTDGAGDRVRKDLRIEATLNVQQLGSMRTWLGMPISMRQAKGIGGMLELFDAEDELGGVGFNDGFVKIGTGSTSTKVRISDVVDRFTYPVTDDVRPGDQTWDHAVRERMQIVQPDLHWD